MTLKNADMRQAIADLMDSETKVQVAIFFRENPGVIDSLVNLAERLGLPQETMQRVLADHARIGVIRERKLADKVIYMVDRTRLDEVSGYVEQLAGAGEVD